MNKELLTPTEAIKHLEQWKEKVNFNQYGNPADRIRLFSQWARETLNMSFDEADKYLRETK